MGPDYTLHCTIVTVDGKAIEIEEKFGSMSSLKLFLLSLQKNYAKVYNISIFEGWGNI